MKYGKVLTCEDLDEAKKLIGKKVVCGDYLHGISEYPANRYSTVLDGLNSDLNYPFLTRAGRFQFVREIIEEEKSQRMTKRQLAEWFARGFGQYRYTGDTPSRTDFSPFLWEENLLVENSVTIRSWDSDEWVLPTVDIYERDCKGGKK